MSLAERAADIKRLALSDGRRKARLGDICHVYTGGTPPKAEGSYWNGDIPWVSPKDMKAEYVADASDHVSQLGVNSSATRIVPANSVLVVVRSGILAHAFPVAVTRVAVAFNQDIKALVADHQQVEPTFLLRALQAASDRILIEGVKKGATVHSMRSGYLENLTMPLPPLPEQRRIVAILNEQMAAVGRARAAVEAQQEAARVLPPAYLRAVFESDEARRWPMRKLRELLRVRHDVVHPRDHPTGSAVFVGLEHIEPGTGVRRGAMEIEMSELTGRKPRFQQGDIVYGYLRPYLNKVWVAEFDGLCSVDQYVLAPRQDVVPHFVGAFMRSPLFLARAPVDSTPGQLPRIRTDELLSVELGLPPVEIQMAVHRQIVTTSARTGRLQGELQEEDARLEDAPRVLLRQAFEGGL